MSYRPDPIQTQSLEELVAWVNRELNRVGVAMEEKLDRIIPTAHSAPAKPRTGLTVLADGVNWDPGSGQGVYTYYNGLWNKLG